VLAKAAPILLDYPNQQASSQVWTTWAWTELGVRTIANMNQLLVDHEDIVAVCGADTLALTGSLASMQNLPVKMRTVAAETCQSLVQHEEWIATHAKVLRSHLPVLVELIVQDPVRDEPSGGDLEVWEAEDPSSQRDEDDSTPGTSAEGSLDVLSEVAPKTTMKTLWPMMVQMAQSDDWLRRRGALVLLSVMAEACGDLIIPKHTAALNAWLGQAAKDPHPRVRHACMHALGQCSTDWAESEWVVDSADALMTLILAVITTDDSLRVRTHALAALINFSEGMPLDVVSRLSAATWQTWITPRLLM